MSPRERFSEQLRMTLGWTIRDARCSRGLSQEDVAFAADVTQGSISNYESGRSEIPLSVLMAVCEYLEISLSDFVSSLVGAGAGRPA